MSRLLLLAVIVALVFLLLKSYSRSAGRSRPPEPVEDMVCCARCGVHLPRSESILAGGKSYCCDAHQREDRP